MPTMPDQARSPPCAATPDPLDRRVAADTAIEMAAIYKLGDGSRGDRKLPRSVDVVGVFVVGVFVVDAPPPARDGPPGLGEPATRAAPPGPAPLGSPLPTCVM